MPRTDGSGDNGTGLPSFSEWLPVGPIVVMREEVRLRDFLLEPVSLGLYTRLPVRDKHNLDALLSQV